MQGQQNGKKTQWGVHWETHFNEEQVQDSNDVIQSAILLGHDNPTIQWDEEGHQMKQHHSKNEFLARNTVG